jgi:hypothetical protein
MRITGLILGAAAAIGCAMPAAATLYRFDVTDPDAYLSTQPMGTYTFYLDSNPTPDSFDGFSFTISGLTYSHTFSDNVTLDQFTFYTADFGGGFGDYENQYIGPVLFTGTTEHPIFKTGTFAINDFIVDGSITITDLSAPPTGGVPEPASWALMLGGFGLVGTAMRRRTTVAFG